MNPISPLQEQSAEHFARRLTARLSEGNHGLPYDISERLRASRVQAVARRKVVAAPQPVRVSAPILVPNGDGTASLGWGGEGGNWWNALASAVAVVTLVVGMFFISTVQEQQSTQEVAEVDAALLTDDLPPSAYTDAGFVQFLKTSHSNTARP